MTIVSNGDAVELVLNGRSLGKGVTSDGFLFTFRDVAWQPGTLFATATHPGVAGRSIACKRSAPRPR